MSIVPTLQNCRLLCVDYLRIHPWKTLASLDLILMESSYKDQWAVPFYEVRLDFRCQIVSIGSEDEEVKVLEIFWLEIFRLVVYPRVIHLNESANSRLCTSVIDINRNWFSSIKSILELHIVEGIESWIILGSYQKKKGGADDVGEEMKNYSHIKNSAEEGFPLIDEHSGTENRRGEGEDWEHVDDEAEFLMWKETVEEDETDTREEYLYNSTIHETSERNQCNRGEKASREGRVEVPKEVLGSILVASVLYNIEEHHFTLWPYGTSPEVGIDWDGHS